MALRAAPSPTAAPPTVAGSTRAVERALALLAEICQHDVTTLAEAARRTRLAPSTALRLLRTLQHTGFVAHGADGSWTPGAQAIALGATVVGRASLVRLAEPALQRIVAATGETAYLIVPGYAGSAVYVGMVEGTRSVRHTSWVGRSIDVRGLAVGRALAGDVAAGGYLAERDVIEPDVTAIAAPIPRPGGIAGALNLLGPTYRIDATAMREYGRIVAREAAAVGRLLGVDHPDVSPHGPETSTLHERRPMITFDAVTKRYPDGTVAVDGLDLVAPSGKITVFVGPSGCGKTTSLRMINRMIDPSSGTIKIDDRDVLSVSPPQLRRGIGYVIQHAGLFPHRTVLDNIATVPFLVGTKKQTARSRAMELLEQVGLDPAFAKRYPAQLSGGQQQRVGVARALAADPPVMLMDEPFSAVDPVVREQLQNEFLRLQQDLGKTIVFVTHDIDEAIKLGDQVAVLRVGGRLAQMAAPAELLARPSDPFVAGFVGRDRGYRALGFTHASGVAVDDEPTVLIGSPIAEGADLARDGWVLIVDDAQVPQGWLAPAAQPRSVQTDGITPDLLNLGGTLTRSDGTLRELLDAALSSPSGRGVVVDEAGALLGTVTAARVLEIIDADTRPARAAEAGQTKTLS